MFSPYGYPYNSMPSATQPYGFPMMNNPGVQNAQQPIAQSSPQSNIVYVNGIEDVKNRQLPPNSNYAFMDNDNPILYRKTVDAQGRMTVEVYDITPHKDIVPETPNYALKSDVDELKKAFDKLRAEVSKK